MKILLLIFALHIVHADILDTLSTSYTNIKDSAKTQTKKIVDKMTPTEKSVEELNEERFNDIWNDLKDKLIDGVELYEKKEKAPESTLFFGNDKKDFKEDIDDVLVDILEVLIDNDLLEYKIKIESINNEIVKKEKKLTNYKEEKIGAPIKSMIHTTKEGYSEKIKNIEDDIGILKNQIRIIKDTLRTSFDNIEIKFNSKQIDTILARVDGDDLIQMVLFTNILNQITSQILILMEESNGNLIQAKRYYGMHLVTVALSIHIQEKYINKLDNDYFPKINNLINEAKKIIYETKISIDKESNIHRQKSYQLNLKSQEQTYKVALMYKENLQEAKNKLKKAQNEFKSNLLLIENTYRTVSLSSDIYTLMRESENIFNKVVAIQMPDIKPFKNIEIAKKYKVLTQKILAD